MAGEGDHRQTPLRKPAIPLLRHGLAFPEVRWR